MTATNTPAAEAQIHDHHVRRLLASQFPAWASLPIERSPAIGFDNTIYRLDADLLVRLPRRPMGAQMVAKQHRWLPELSRRLPVPIPVPLGKGVPDQGYPWHWSVCPWLPGRIAPNADIDDLDAFAATLGSFIAALQVRGPHDGAPERVPGRSADSP